MGRPLAICSPCCARSCSRRRAVAYTFGPTVQQLGPEQTVFDWDTHALRRELCRRLSRARLAGLGNQVHLTISSNHSYAMVGST